MTVNKFGEVSAYTDRNGNTTEYERDSNGNVTRQTNPDSSYKEYTYDSKNNMLSAKDELGKYTFYVYDANNINLLKVAQPLNGTDVYSAQATQADFAITTYTYYSDYGTHHIKGLLNTVTDPTGAVTAYTYDDYGNQATVINPLSKTTTYSYNILGWLKSVTTPEGYTTSCYYDRNGSLLRQVNPDSGVVRNVYDFRNNVVQTVQPEQYDASADTAVTFNAEHIQSSGSNAYTETSHGARSVYLDNGLLSTYTDPCGNTTSYTCDLYGNTLTETMPNGAVYGHAYDVMNRIWRDTFRKTSVDVRVTLAGYDYDILEDGTTTSTVTKYFDEYNSAVTTTYYDYAGRQIGVDQADGTDTASTYNINGTLASSTDARGNTTYYAYDGLNRLIQKWSPVGDQEYAFSSTDYDKAGRVILNTKAKDTVANGIVPATNLIWTSYTYNADGTVSQELTSSGVKTVYGYDDDGNVSSRDLYYDATSYKHVEYDYNYLNKVTAQRETVENQDITGYDSTSTPLVLTTSYTYDLNGNVLTRIDANGITVTYTYDPMDRQRTSSQPGLDETGAAVTITTARTYDWAGNVLTSTDALGNITANTYDEREFLTKVTDALNGVRYYVYDRAGRKTAEVTPNNYLAETDLSALSRTEYTYDEMDRVLLETENYYDTISSSWAQFVSNAYTYDENGNVTEKQDALGYQENYGTQYFYDDSNKLIQESDPENQSPIHPYSKQYAYDGAGRKLTETDANGKVTEYTYNDSGLMLTKTVDGKLIQTNTYDLQGNLLTAADGNGNVTAYTYNHLNQARSMTLPGDSSIGSYTVTYRYTALGQLAEQLDSMGKQALYTYDNQGRKLTATEQKSDATQVINLTYRYDEAGNLRYQTDGNGNTTTYTYDALDRKIGASLTVTDCLSNAATQTTTYIYDADGNQTGQQDWLGNVYGFVYDALDRLIEKTDPNGTTIEKLVYNDNGAQIYSLDALDHLTEFVYDRNGRLTETINELDNSQTQYYDGVGNVIQKEDANGNDTYYTYDGLNRLIGVENALGETTAYTYDNAGNLLTQTDGEGNVTTVQYNCRSLPILRIDAGGILPDESIDETKATGFTYYADGSMETKTDRNGLETDYTYDIHGRLLTTEAGDETISYTYDGNGNQLTVTNTSGTVTRLYDELNRTISKTVSGQGEFTYQYDVTTGMPAYFTGEIITDPKSNLTTKVYDRAGRLYQVISGTDTTAYTYYDNGNRWSVTYPNGLTAEYTYYDDNRLHTLANMDGNTILEAFSYAYDDNGNMSSKTDVKGTTSFTYDDLNRLASITEQDGTVTGYTYDAAGNRDGKTVTANNEVTTTSYDYNAQNRLTGTEEDLSTGESVLTDYFYDHNGNTTATREQTLEDAETGLTVCPAVGNDLSGSSVYEYDGFDQLTTAYEDQFTLHMVYNGEGLRVSKEASSDGLSGETQYLYEYSHVVLELDGSGDQTAYNVYGGDMLVSRTADGETLYYLYNGHGDVTALTDGDGDVVTSYYYDVFGNVVEETGSADNSVNYAGYEYDEETGLYYLNARYYNPETARFLTEDTYYGTSSDPLSLNLYTYCDNNPVRFLDPTGHYISEWDKQNLSSSELENLQQYTYNYEHGIDPEGAHAAAVALRQKYMMYGDQLDADGNMHSNYQSASIADPYGSSFGTFKSTLRASDTTGAYGIYSMIIYERIEINGQVYITVKELKGGVDYVKEGFHVDSLSLKYGEFGKSANGSYTNVVTKDIGGSFYDIKVNMDYVTDTPYDIVGCDASFTFSHGTSNPYELGIVNEVYLQGYYDSKNWYSYDSNSNSVNPADIMSSRWEPGR